MMKTFKNIEFVASGGGRYLVFVDGVQVSQHNTFHKAQERATVEQLRNPDSEVYFEQNLRVDVSLTLEDVVQDEPVDPVDEEPTDKPVYIGVFKTE